MKRSVLFGCLCLLLAGALSCSRCQATRATSGLSGLIPGDVPAVMILPDLKSSSKRLDTLLTKFSVGPLASFISQGKLEIKRRLGFDPLDVKGWQSIGLDPARGIAIGLAPGNSLMAAGLSDAKIFADQIQKRMRDLAAADQVSSKKVGDVTVTTLSAKVGQRDVPRLHYAFAGKFVLVCGPAGSPEFLAACAGQDKAKSLAGAKWYTDLSAKVDKGADLMVIANGPAISKSMAQKSPKMAAAIGEGVAASLSFGPQGIALDSFVGLAQASAKKLVALTDKVTDAHLERRLPKDTILAFKVRANVEKALETAFEANPELKAQYEKSLELAKHMLRVDVSQATIDNLTGNAVLGISVSGADQLNKLVANRGHSGADIDSAFQLLWWTELKDGVKYKNLLDDVISTAAERFPGKRSTEGPLDVVTLPTEKGVELYLLNSGNLAGMCLGRGCTKAAAATISGKGGNLATGMAAGSKNLFSQPSLVAAVFDFGRVTSLLKQLDATALGDSGMMVKMVLDMVLNAVASLDRLSAVLRPAPDGVHFLVQLVIKTP